MRLIVRGLMIALFCVPMAGWAVPILQTANCTDNANGSCATGIQNLEVMNMTFNVSFESGSYDSVFGANNPFFIGDLAGANAARDAINALLQGVVSGVFAQGTGSSQFFVTHSNDQGSGTFVNFAAGLSTVPTGTAWVTGLGGAPSNQNLSVADHYASFAVFDKLQSVPEPSTFLLLAFGLTGLALRRRATVCR